MLHNSRSEVLSEASLRYFRTLETIVYVSTSGKTIENLVENVWMKQDKKVTSKKVEK